MTTTEHSAADEQPAGVYVDEGRRRLVMAGLSAGGLLLTQRIVPTAHAQEPVTTFAFVGTAVASGVLAFVGGELFKTAIGFPTLDGVVGAAAADLKAFIEKIEEQNFLDTCNRRVQGLYSLLQQYHNAPTTSESRLNTIDTESNELMYLLVGRGVESYPIFVMAVCLRTAALYTRYQRFQDPGELTNLKSLLGVSGDSLQGMLQQLRDKVAVKVSPVEFAGVGTTTEKVGNAYRVRYKGIYRYYVNGGEKKVIGPEEAIRDRAIASARPVAEAARKADIEHYAKIAAQAEEAFAKPGDKVKSIWEQITIKVSG